MEKTSEKLSEKKLQLLMMEVLQMERKNLRTKAKDDGKMAEDIGRKPSIASKNHYEKLSCVLVPKT